MMTAVANDDFCHFPQKERLFQPLYSFIEVMLVRLEAVYFCCGFQIFIPCTPPSSNVNASLIPIISTSLVEQIYTGVPEKQWEANFTWVLIWFFCLSSCLFHPLHCDQNALSKHTLQIFMTSTPSMVFWNPQKLLLGPAR